jgi:hypothetical protein
MGSLNFLVKDLLTFSNLKIIAELSYFISIFYISNHVMHRIYFTWTWQNARK